MADRHIQICDQLERNATAEAARLGLSFDELVAMALHDFVDSPVNGIDELLAQVTAFVDRHFSTESFPPNVTQRVFGHIRRTPYLWSLYEAEICDADGCPDPHARQSLNHRVEALVASRLHAQLEPTMQTLNPERELAECCSLLRPTE
jgi:hypothetical protein